MRIVCQKCSAAYAIDDQVLTAKGVRAQCPRCRNLQLVKLDDAAAAAPPPLPRPPGAKGPADFQFDLPPLPPDHGAVSEVMDFKDLGLPPARGAAAPAPAPRPAPSLAPPPAEDFLDFSDLNSSSPAVPVVAPPPPSRPAAPVSRPPVAARPPAAAPRAAPSSPRPMSSAPATADLEGDFGPRGQMLTVSTPGTPNPLSAPSDAALNLSFEAPARAAPITCKSCRKVLTDPFDQALGVCDDCRSASSAQSQALALGDVPTESAPVARPSRPRAQPAPNFEDEDFDGEAQPRTVVEVPSAPRPKRAVQSAMREDEEPEGSGRGKTVVIALLAVLVLGGGGAFLAIKRPWVRKAPPLAQRLPVGTPRPIESMVERWKQRSPEPITGSAAEYMRAGEEKLAMDTAQGYADAETQFQKALVLDKSLDQAVAGWVLAMVFGRGTQIDDETAKMAEQMLVAAGQRGGDNRVFIAQSHLLLARGGNFNDIKALADRGLSSPSDKDKALANLALGELYLGKSPQYATEHFKKALELDPKLKRGYLYQARLAVSQGELQSAAASFKKRLELDADQWEASDGLGRLYLEVSELPSAKATYQKAREAAPTAFQPRLALGVLAYQHEADLPAALSQFDELLKTKASLEQKDLVELLGHRAAAARLAGDLDGAAASAQQALDLKVDDVQAHLQRFLVALEQGKNADARSHLSFLKLGDKALEQALEGRLLLAEGKLPEALAVLQKAIEADPRRTDALLLGAAAAAKNKNEVKAWELALKKGLKADPLQSGPLPVMARFYVRPADLLKVARGAFAPLARDKEDPNPALAEGLVAWHSGDWAAADAAFARVVAADTANGAGFAFRTLLALRKKDLVNAAKWGPRAAEGDKKLGLGSYALGCVQIASGKVEAARKTLRVALDSAPGLLAAKVKMAETDIKVKKPGDARVTLAAVLLADPGYFEARRVLFQVPAP